MENMTRVSFSVPFVKGKARPRFSKGRAYTPKGTKDAERQIESAYRHACRDAFGALQTASEGVPVLIEIWTTRNVLSGFRRRDGDSHDDLQKPDADNIAKLVLDALNGVAYEDDSQVVGLFVAKGARVRGNKPTTRVHVHWRD